MTCRFRSRFQAILMGMGYALTWKLCPSIPTWKQYPPKTHGHGWVWAWVWAPDVGLYCNAIVIIAGRLLAWVVGSCTFPRAENPILGCVFIIIASPLSEPLDMINFSCLWIAFSTWIHRNPCGWPPTPSCIIPTHSKFGVRGFWRQHCQSGFLYLRRRHRALKFWTLTTSTP
jgi:hypothetical protein